MAAFIGILGILGAPRENVWANDVALLETVYGTDYVAAAVGGLRDTANAGINLSGVSGTINKAYLYWHGPMNSTNPLANATIRVNNQSVTGVNIGYSDDNCWGFNNSQAYRADVTSLVRAERNGTYFLSQYVKQGTNINANGASLLVFFNDSNPANDRDIVIFEGNDSNADNFYDALGWNVSLSGINYTSGRGFFQLHVSDGQVYEDDALLLNGEVIEARGEVFQGTTVQAANNGPGGTGRLWDVKTYEVTELLADGTNSLTLTHGYLGRDRRPKGDCVSLIVSIINLPEGAAPANSAPVVTGTPVITVNSANPIVVSASVTDADGDPLTYTIAIDGVVVATNAIPAGSPATTGALSITNGFSLGQHTVIFTANDGTASGSFTTVVNVIDNTPPTLIVPPNKILGSDPGMTNAVVNFANEIIATDDFPGVMVISLPPSGTAFPIGTTTISVTAVDASGNRTNATFTITVTDCFPPTIDQPKDLLRPTDPGRSNAVVNFTVNARDNLPGVTVTCDPSSGSVFQIGVTMVVCTARDAAGNTATKMFTVTVVDREPPVLNVPTNIVVMTDAGQSNAVVNYSVTATDNVPGVTVSCTPPSGSAFPLGTNTVTCVATDANNNQTTRSFTVTVMDREAPVITTPVQLIIPTDPGTNNAIVTYTVTITDNVPGSTINCVPPSGATFPLGTTTVVCTGADTTGNKTTNSFIVTVEDRQPPVINIPPGITVPTGPGTNNAVVTYNVTVTDNTPGANVNCQPPSGATFPLGVTTVVCTATDTTGNQATNTFTVTVEDRERPVVTVPANIIVPTDPGLPTAVVTYTATVSDNVPGATVVCVPPSGVAFPMGVTTVVCTGTDTTGNRATNSFTVTVEDRERPALIVPENIIRTIPSGQTSAIVDFTVSATDNSGSATVTCVPPSGSAFPLGVTTVNCTARDMAGNTTTGSFTVTVNTGNNDDNTPPVITVPSTIIVPTDAGTNNAVVTYTVTVSDNQPGATVVCAPPPGAAFPIGTNAVACVATDAANNKATNGFLVVVEDRERPALNLPENIIRTIPPGQTSTVVDFTVSATDNSGSATVTCVPPSGSAFPLGVTTVNCTARDTAGNTTTGSFTVTINTGNNGDDVPPVITVPATIIVPTDPGLPTAVVNYTATVSDNQPGATLVCLPPPGSAFLIGTNTVTCIATDAAGNKATNSFIIIVEDRERPSLVVPADITINVTPGQTGAVVTFNATATDNSGSVSVTCVPPSGSVFPLGLTLVTCTATDPSGNASTGTFTVGVVDPSIRDVEPPVITVPPGIVVPTDPGTNNAVVTYTVTVTDNRPGATVVCQPPSGSIFPVGVSTVVCTAMDVAGNKATNQFTVTVEDRERPTLILPPNIVRPVDPGTNIAVVTYTVIATDNSGSVAVVCVPPSGSAFSIGVTTVTCTAIDDSGNTTTGSFTVTVTDGKEPPDYGCITPSKKVIWPPNHKMVPINLWLTYDKKKVKFSSARIISVTSNEPQTGLWPDDASPDWEIVNATKLKLRLRAERDDRGTGRVYTITVEAKDKKGNVYICKTTVTVPLENPKKPKTKPKGNGPN